MDTICSVMISIDMVVVYCYNYVKDCFVHIYNLEFLPIFILYFGHKFCISVFYRHSNSAYIFDTLFTTLAALNVSIFPPFFH